MRTELNLGRKALRVLQNGDGEVVKRLPVLFVCTRYSGKCSVEWNSMTEGEIAYLTMVSVLFVAFILVIGSVTAGQSKRK